MKIVRISITRIEQLDGYSDAEGRNLKIKYWYGVPYVTLTVGGLRSESYNHKELIKLEDFGLIVQLYSGPNPNTFSEHKFYYVDKFGKVSEVEEYTEESKDLYYDLSESKNLFASEKEASDSVIMRSRA